MRILTIANVPCAPHLGSGYVVLGYTNGLRERGHEVELLDPSAYEPLYGVTRRAIRYRQIAGMAHTALRLVDAGFDVMEFYGGEAFLALELLARVPGRDFLLVAHSNGVEPHAAAHLPMRSTWAPIPRLDLTPAFARGFRRADAIVTVSEFDASFARREGYAPAHRILALDNPVDDVFREPASTDGRRQRVIYCGSWLPRKGREELAEGFSEFLRLRPDWDAVLVGVGTDFSVASWFPDDVAGRVHVVAQSDRQSLRDLLCESSIAAFASRYESFGLAIAEAMACGCAVVSTRVGFAAELRDGIEAVLLEKGSGEEIARALAALAADGDLRRRLGAEGRRRALAQSWNVAVDRLEASYRQWLAELRRAA